MTGEQTMDTAQRKTGRERRSYERLDAERRASQAETLRSAARDLTLTGPMDATQTAAWLTQRAQRIERPEPLHPLVRALVVAAFVVGLVVLVTLLIVAITTGALNHPWLVV